MKKILLLAVLLLLCITTPAQIITTFAGGGTSTSGLGDGGLAVDAEIGQPIGVAIDAAGNAYISDRDNNRIRKVNTAGVITTIAGTGTVGYSGDGASATAANLYQPYGVAVDNAGNVYFADAGNSCIRKINTSGIISTIAGTGTHGYNGDNIPATTAELYSPADIAVDATGNVYFADGYNNRIRKINTSGIITSIAGTGIAGDTGDNGLATAAELNGPFAIILDGTGNIYIGEEFGDCVRKINTSGIITTIAGAGGIGGFSGDNGPATAATLAHVLGLALDVAGNLYISDNLSYRIRKVNASGIITTYAGNGAPDYNGDNIQATAADIAPTGLALDPSGNLYIADFNNRIRRITSTLSANNINNIQGQVLLYPNPTDRDFTINILSDIDEKAQVTITNTAGEKIKGFTTVTNKPLNVKLDERSGLYFMLVTTSHGAYNAKLVVI